MSVLANINGTKIDGIKLDETTPGVHTVSVYFGFGHQIDLHYSKREDAKKSYDLYSHVMEGASNLHNETVRRQLDIQAKMADAALEKE